MIDEHFILEPYTYDIRKPSIIRKQTRYADQCTQKKRKKNEILATCYGKGKRRISENDKF